MISPAPPVSPTRLKVLAQGPFLDAERAAQYVGTTNRTWRKFSQDPTSTNYRRIPKIMYELLLIGTGELVIDKIDTGNTDVATVCSGPWTETYSSGNYEPPAVGVLVEWMNEFGLSRSGLANEMGTTTEKLAANLIPSRSKKHKKIGYASIRYFLIKVGAVEPEPLPSKAQRS